MPCPSVLHHSAEARGGLCEDTNEALARKIPFPTMQISSGVHDT